jgi:hypothetical protein
MRETSPLVGINENLHCNLLCSYHIVYSFVVEMLLLAEGV